MILQGVISKFGAVFIIIPEPIVGGIFCVMFGMICAFGECKLVLRFVLDRISLLQVSQFRQSRKEESALKMPHCICDLNEICKIIHRFHKENVEFIYSTYILIRQLFLLKLFFITSYCLLSFHLYFYDLIIYFLFYYF